MFDSPLSESSDLEHEEGWCNVSLMATMLDHTQDTDLIFWKQPEWDARKQYINIDCTRIRIKLQVFLLQNPTSQNEPNEKIRPFVSAKFFHMQQWLANKFLAMFSVHLIVAVYLVGLNFWVRNM